MNLFSTPKAPSKLSRLLVAGGGTGGHLFPGIAVVEELRRRFPELDVLFVGTERGIEARVLPERNERFLPLDVRPLMGRSGAELARSLSVLPKSALSALGCVRAFQPDVTLGLGGYAAGPILLAAAAQRVPTALLEQNAHVGLTNRLLARAVGRAYLTFEETLPTFGETRGRLLGNPVRRAFVQAARRALHDPIGVEARARTVLVLGGSQGARALNTHVPAALARAGVRALGVRVVHQTGAAMVDEVSERYEALGIDASVVPFIDDVASAYLDAALVVARAGATTLAELCAVGRASVLVPYPHAAADHQTTNALALERAGAAICLREEDLSEVALADHVATLLAHPDRRRAMADAARRRGRPDAAAAIVDDLLAFLGVPSDSAPDPAGSDESVAPAGGAPSSIPPSAYGTRRKAKVRRAELRLRTVCEPAGHARAALSEA
jgi:UDP-N-acetylglucosamine--N-acetylmuramyl-(pentapeptide) pyrophosphoryl-undecaprenol N-acetylglucosamine transferase